jgi:hypothetical protein
MIDLQLCPGLADKSMGHMKLERTLQKFGTVVISALCSLWYKVQTVGTSRWLLCASLSVCVLAQLTISTTVRCMSETHMHAQVHKYPVRGLGNLRCSVGVVKELFFNYPYCSVHQFIGMHAEWRPCTSNQCAMHRYLHRPAAMLQSMPVDYF